MRKNIGLYRGKRVDNGEWVEGWLIVNRVDREPEPEEIYCYILAYGKGESYVTWYPVDPETVGECSGVPDKDGVRIYEGDILKIVYLCQKPVTAVVEFTDGKFTARYTRNEKEHIDTLSGTASSLYKIIGNVHDNPELLGGDTR